MHTGLLGYLGHNWGWILLRGVAAVLFGVLAIAWPGITLATLVIVWGAYALAEGLLTLIAAWQVPDEGRPFWSLVVVGLLGIAAGRDHLPVAGDHGAHPADDHCRLGADHGHLPDRRGHPPAQGDRA